MTSDLNQVLRQLRRSPGITATAAPSRLEKRSPLSKIFREGQHCCPRFTRNAAPDSESLGRSLHLLSPGVQGCIVFRVANENTCESGRWKQAIFVGTGTAANFIHGY